MQSLIDPLASWACNSARQSGLLVSKVQTSLRETLEAFSTIRLAMRIKFMSYSLRQMWNGFFFAVLLLCLNFRQKACTSEQRNQDLSFKLAQNLLNYVINVNLLIQVNGYT